jgi:hypothetical protein
MLTHLVDRELDYISGKYACYPDSKVKSARRTYSLGDCFNKKIIVPYYAAVDYYDLLTLNLSKTGLGWLHKVSEVGKEKGLELFKIRKDNNKDELRSGFIHFTAINQLEENKQEDYKKRFFNEDVEEDFKFYEKEILPKYKRNGVLFLAGLSTYSDEIINLFSKEQ